MIRIKSVITAMTAIAAWSYPVAARPAETASAPPPAAPAAPATLAEAITGGRAALEFRYRLESVEQEPFEDDAFASTLRSRLNYRTAAFRGWTAFVEADNVTVLGNDDTYASTRNGVTDRPTVADPEYTELNQAWLQFKGDALLATLGRQRIVLDNQRFVGNVGWRQNEQTYDAVSVQSAGLEKLQLQYSYLDNVNRVFGPDDGNPLGDFRSNSHLLNGRLEAGAIGRITAFGYLLDFDNSPAVSSSTYGLHWAGTYALAGKTRTDWIASWASQSDHGDNPNDYSANYLLLEATIGAGGFGATIGYESLSGDRALPNRAFQTPLATLHAFQGWADKFLTTPPQGVDDLYIAVSAPLGPVAFKLIWHDFESEATGAGYGSEWNASATWKFGKRYEALVKLADYSADGFATDTTKAWAQFSAIF